ncbi:hypothetical protein Bbelb_021310 [Branchiostoma belcheri]|nr:hypothetical protein Bbelb_021310 [Branchiostoma belcheri]
MGYIKDVLQDLWSQSDHPAARPRFLQLRDPDEAPRGPGFYSYPQWFGHVTRNNNLTKIILQGTLEGKRRRGRQKKVWQDNIKDWTSLTVPQLLTAAQDRRTWLHSCCKVCLVLPTISASHRTRKEILAAPSSRRSSYQATTDVLYANLASFSLSPGFKKPMEYKVVPMDGDRKLSYRQYRLCSCSR